MLTLGIYLQGGSTYLITKNLNKMKQLTKITILIRAGED